MQFQGLSLLVRIVVCALFAGVIVGPRIARAERGSYTSRTAPKDKVGDDDTDAAHNTPDPAPPVPNVLDEEPHTDKVTVLEQAGVGGPLAYASANVLEVGGGGSMSVSGRDLYVRLAPFVAWFAMDGFRLSYTHEIYTTKIEKEYRFSTAVLLGGSVHFRVNDRLLVALGPEVGPLYNGDKWGVIIRPSAKLDILVGRSALLHPGFLFAWSSTDIIDASGRNVPDHRMSYGLDIAYSAMF